MAEKIDPRAGKPVTPDMLVDVPRLITAYFRAEAGSGQSHRESIVRVPNFIAARRSKRNFNEAHILADQPGGLSLLEKSRHRRLLFLGMDIHAGPRRLLPARSKCSPPTASRP